MNSKEYFQNVYTAVRKLQVLRERRNVYLSMGLSSPGMSSDGIHGGSIKSSRTEKAALELAELSEGIESHITELSAILLDAERILEQLDPSYARILQMRYIQCLRWSEIQHALGCDAATTYRRHGRALQAAGRILESIEKRID